LTRTRTRRKSRKQTKPIVSPTVIVLVIAAALLIVGGLVILSNQPGNVDVSGFPTKGDVNAPVTIIDYSDYG
jgi:hypothetical protein